MYSLSKSLSSYRVPDDIIFQNQFQAQFLYDKYLYSSNTKFTLPRKNLYQKMDSSKNLTTRDWFWIQEGEETELTKDQKKFLCAKRNKVCRSLFRLLIWGHRNLEEAIYLSQERMASSLRVSLSTVKRALLKLQLIGLIRSRYNHRQTKDYLILVKVYYNCDLPLYRDNNKRVCSASWRDTTQPFCSSPKLNFSSIAVIQSNRFSQSTKKEDMYNGLPDYLSKVITDIKLLKLTTRGQVGLTPYPDKAITAALHKLRRASNVRNPYAGLLQYCDEYCRQKAIRPNYDEMYIILEKFGIDRNAPFVVGKSSVEAKAAILTRELATTSGRSATLPPTVSAAPFVETTPAKERTVAPSQTPFDIPVYGLAQAMKEKSSAKKESEPPMNVAQCQHILGKWHKVLELHRQKHPEGNGYTPIYLKHIENAQQNLTAAIARDKVSHPITHEVDKSPFAGYQQEFGRRDWNG